MINKVEILEAVVNEVVSRVENITTPTKKETKKRRRVNQTPSPSHTGDAVLEQPVDSSHSQGAPQEGYNADPSDT